MAGDAFCVIEVMKMEITLSAERAAMLSKLNVGLGDALAPGAVIIEFAE